MSFSVLTAIAFEVKSARPKLGDLGFIRDRAGPQEHRMFIDAYELEPDVQLTTDICIVGAGAAGITLARSLMGTGRQVSVLESGGFDYEQDTQALCEAGLSVERGINPNADRVRIYGGSTYHWEGMCLPLQTEDFAQRAYVPNSGWPISLADVEPYYERAHETLEVGRFVYDAQTVAEQTAHQLLALDPERVVTRMYRSSPPTRLGQRAFFEDADDVTVYLHANLVNIRLSADARNHVDALECRTLRDNRFTVRAKLVVLATGGLENARLLLASRDQFPEGVANRSGAVGRYFMEHPHYYYGLAATMPTELPLEFYRPHTSSAAKQERVFGALALAAPLRAQEGLLAATVQLVPTELEMAADISEVSPAAIRALLSTDTDMEFNYVKMILRGEQSPWWESRVSLAEQQDALGMPRLDVHWQLHPDDNAQLQRTLTLLGTEMARAGLGRLWFPQQDGRYMFRLRGGAHHMGTTRMGEDPKTSVVDSNCRAHDVDNLYIAGSSVFVTGGDANPTLTIVALAHRLAEHLSGLDA